MRLKVVDYDAMRAAFEEKFKETHQLILNGETHLDNLAEGFHEADGVIWRLPTIDAVPITRCSECKNWLSYPSLGVNYCGLHKGLAVANKDTYCSYAERKE